ncbi:MAG TPA: SBBP repeat-containing protein [Chroococcidiopsis sp.]
MADKLGNSLNKSRLVRLGSTATQANFADAVTLKDKDDILVIRLDKRASFNAVLSGLPKGANADIQLYSLKGSKTSVLKRIGKIVFSKLTSSQIKTNLVAIAQSRKAGNKPEAITTRVLAPGEYYLRIQHRSGNAKFKLNLKTTLEQSSPSPTPGSPSPTPGSPSPGPTPGPSGVLNRLAKKQFGTAGNDYAYGVFANNDGVSIAGSTEGTLGGANLGRSDSYVTRFDGNLAGVANTFPRQFGAASEDRIFDIEVLSDGSYIVAGAKVSFLNTTPTGSNGFIQKFNSSGTSVWEKTIDASFIDAASSLAVDAQGNIYVAGLIDGTPEISIGIGVIPAVPTKAFIAKYDSSGNVVNGFGTNGIVRYDSTAGSEAASGIAIDSTGRVYITGVQGATLNPANLDNPLSGGDAFVARFNGTTGAIDNTWTKTLSSGGSQDYARGIAIFGDNVYITGNTDGTLPGQSTAGGTDGFVAKYSITGSSSWVKQFGTAGLDESQGITVDSSGRIIVVGETTGGLFGETAQGGSDAFIALYSDNGTSTTQLAGKLLGTLQDDEAYGVTTNGSSIYVVGQTQGALGDGTAQSAGNYDAWIAKYEYTP